MTSSERAGSFDHYVQQYAAQMDEPWADMLYQLLFAQLGQVLTPTMRSALTVGCGLGTTDRFLAEQGLAVTGTDIAPAMVEFSAQQAAEAGLAITYRVQDAMTARFDQPFDLIVCHNVLEYVDLPEFVIANLATSLRSDGLLSLVLHNPTAKVLKAAVFNQDPERALALLDQREFHYELMNKSARAYTLKEAVNWLHLCGLEVVEHFGVRTLYDLIPNQPKYDPAWHQQALKMELELSKRSPFQEIAMFHHLIASKKG